MARANWQNWIGAAIILAAAAATIAFLWRAAGPARGVDDKTVLRVGDQRGGAQALLTAAGELHDVPYHIEWDIFPAAAPLLEALGASAIDIGGIGGAPFAFAYASGLPIRAVHAYRPLGGLSRASAIIVRKDSSLSKVADLKGKRLATIRGSAGQDLALQLLERGSLKASDVRWVYLPNGDAKAALGAGSIDAWSTWGSYVGIAVIEDHDRVLADATGIPSGAGFYAASDTAITDKRPLLADFIRRLARARAWAVKHPDDYAKVLAREIGIPFKVARFSVNGVLGEGVPIDAPLIAEQDRIFERYVRAGIIPKVPDVHAGYDGTFNDAVRDAAR
ncbi:ABC transporter substrate-binding protein [soil metagenome]